MAFFNTCNRAFICFALILNLVPTKSSWSGFCVEASEIIGIRHLMNGHFRELSTALERFEALVEACANGGGPSCNRIGVLTRELMSEYEYLHGQFNEYRDLMKDWEDGLSFADNYRGQANLTEGEDAVRLNQEAADMDGLAGMIFDDGNLKLSEFLSHFRSNVVPKLMRIEDPYSGRDLTIKVNPANAGSGGQRAAGAVAERMIEIMKDRGWVEGTHYRIEPDGVDIRNPQSPIQIQVSHQDGWRILQHETGQHRVRMPKSGGSGLATNPVTVRVLPDTTVMAQFDESLIKTSASSAGGAGGQGRDHNNHKITLTYEDPVSGRKLVASSEEKTDRNTNYNNALRRLREQVTEAQAQANSILDPSTQIEANATGRIIRTLELGNARTDADRDLVRIVENNFSLRDDGNSTEFNPPDWRAYRMSPDALRIRDESRLDNLLSQNPPPEMPPAHLQQQWRNSTR